MPPLVALGQFSHLSACSIAPENFADVLELLALTDEDWFLAGAWVYCLELDRWRVVILGGWHQLDLANVKYLAAVLIE